MLGDDSQRKVAAVPLTRLLPAPWNPRSIKDERFQNLCRSLEGDPEFLWLRPILATADGTVFGGNMRLRAAEHLGWETVPAVLLDIPEQLAKERALKDNGSWGEWLEDNLAALIAELGTAGSELGLLGFDEDNLRRLLDRLGKTNGLTDPDDVPDLPEEPITQPGDLWLLGEHRILCGDATDPHDVAIAMAGDTAHCLWTDPPFGVEYEGGTREKLRIRNDTPDALMALLQDSFATVDPHLRPGATFYIAHPDVFAWEFVSAVRSRGWVQARPAVVLWIKDRLVLGKGDYHSRSEPLLYGWKPGAPHRRVTDRSQDNVWEIPRPAKNEEHPTMKPVELVARSLRNSTRSGDLVCDPFLGSGSTLIACEQLERRCYGLDLDPRYVDVAVRRWERFTGREARRTQPSENEAAEAKLAAMGLGRVKL